MADTQEPVPTWTGTQVPPEKMADTVAELVDKSATKKLNGNGQRPSANGNKPEAVGEANGPLLADVGAPRSSSRTQKTLILAAAIFCLAALAALIAAAVVFARSDGGQSTDVETSASSNPSTETERESSTADQNDDVIDVPSESSSESSPGTEEQIEVLDLEHQAVAEASGETSWAVFDQSILYLRGKVPSQEFAGMIEERVSAVMPSDSIVVEFSIDPSVAAPVDPPLFVKERVLFIDGTAEVAPASFGLIGIAELLMKRYTVTDITVLSYAPDADGNLDQDLASAQSQAVIDVWIERGIDPSRLKAEFIENPGDDGDQQWVEFVVVGLLE